MDDSKRNLHLAEFYGIMLGDGCSQPKSYQITISGGTIDGTYITEYIPKLIWNIFSRKVRFRKIVREGFDCLLASKAACDLMAKMEFVSPKINCKILEKFFSDEDLLKACVRGLFDTDGGLHRHHKRSAQLKFTNKSVTIIDSLQRALTQMGYKPSRTIDHKEKNTDALYLFSKDVKRYFTEIGSSNPKNQLKFTRWIETGIVPLNIEIEKEVRLTKEVQEALLGKSIDDIKFCGFAAQKTS